MFVIYISIFVLSIFFSAFFSSAETSVLSLNKIKLNLKARRKNKKALLLTRILNRPEEFFSTILIGNNFVNIAAASISTVLFTHLLPGREQLGLLLATLFTTIIILIFAEIIPKSYAFRYSERMSDIYAYPIRFFSYLFYPLVRVTAFISNLLLKPEDAGDEKMLTIEEIKHFLSTQVKLPGYSRESLRMINEVLDIADKDIKSIMTPRLNITALEENAGADGLKQIVLEKRLTKIPIFRNNLDNITGIIHTDDILLTLLDGGADIKALDVKTAARPPLFVSEYSSLIYTLKQFKIHGLNIAVVVDEYGSTIGILTPNDIFREILGEIQLGRHPIKKIGADSYVIKGAVPVEEVNEQLHLQLPQRVEYATMSGLFTYHYGKFPQNQAKVDIDPVRLTVARMGKRKIEELLLTIPKK